MKILLLSHSFYPAIGGIEINSEVLADAFLVQGHELKVVTWTKEQGMKQFDYDIVRDPKIPVLLELHRWADLIFENNPCLRLAWPALFTDRPVVTALCTWVSRLDGRLAWQDKLKLRWLKRAKSVIAVSDSIREKCFPAAVVIGNPYNNSLFRVLPRVKKTRDFVFLGRLVTDKGAEMAVQALNILTQQEKYVDLSLTIIGEGPELSPLKELSGTLRLKSNIHFTGPLRGEELVTVLNQHQYMLIPSVWEEPFGNVALEGMACGCIPLVSDGGGLPDAVGNAGLLFKRGDLNDLVRSMKMILSDSALRDVLSANAGGHLENHYPEEISKQYLCIMEQANNYRS